MRQTFKSDDKTLRKRKNQLKGLSFVLLKCTCTNNNGQSITRDFNMDKLWVNVVSLKPYDLFF